ncbi:MAG TPA: hypothetical protein VGD07_06085 [Methylomirabilota bacterium]|jgi:hypothetical protein
MLTRVMRCSALRSIPEAAWTSAALLIASAVLAAVIGGCATRGEVEQRTTQGPTAQQMLNLRVLEESGREPTFEERRQWDEQIEQRIAAYLRAHPEKVNALDVSTFRFLRQVAVGMDKEQVLILLGAPASISDDQARMEKIARRYWPQIQGNATEVWVYPLGWNLFFAGQRLIDITQFVPPS